MNPHRARDVLQPYAMLHFRLLSARDLLAKDIGILRHSADPYYEILVDDKTYHVSEPVMDNLNPTFNDPPVPIPIWHPMTVVTIKLMDYDNPLKRMFHGDELIGFVELQIKDLPFNQDICGWLELRLEDFLVGTSTERIEEHRALRDDMAYERPEQASIIESKKYQQNAFCGCFPDRPGGLRISARVPNAGCLLVEMNLQTETSWNELFAYSLPRPVPIVYDRSIIAKKHALPELNVPKLIDHATWIGDTLWKNGALCFIDAILYVLTWKECWISFIFTCGLVCMVIFPRFGLAIFVASIAFWLYILSSRKRRTRMVASPERAPLNDEGFALVAMLRSTQKMIVWVERVIVQVLRGVIDNHNDLELFSSSIFRDGAPLLSFDQLLFRLKHEKVIIDPYATAVSISEQQKKKNWLTLPTNAFHPKEKVKVKQFARPEVKATVLSVEKGDTYTLSLEDGTSLKGVPESEMREDAASNAVVANIPAWLIPDQLEAQIREMQPVVGNVRYQLRDVYTTFTRIVTWHNPAQNRLLCGVLIGIAVLLGLANGFLEAVSWYIHLVVFLFLAVFICIFYSWWFQVFVNFCTSTTSWMQHRKKPQHGNLDLAYFINIRPDHHHPEVIDDTRQKALLCDPNLAVNLMPPTYVPLSPHDLVTPRSSPYGDSDYIPYTPHGQPTAPPYNMHPTGPVLLL